MKPPRKDQTEILPTTPPPPPPARKEQPARPDEDGEDPAQAPTERPAQPPAHAPSQRKRGRKPSPPGGMAVVVVDREMERDRTRSLGCLASAAFLGCELIR